jgi:OmpA-OmpF porin, OOP family
MLRTAVVALLALVASVAVAQGPARARLAGDHIELLQPVTFETGNDTLTAEGALVLDEVVRILLQHPELSVDIGVHTDSSGASGFNQALTDGRARSIASYLTGHGIMRNRVRAAGYGESRPIDSNTTAEGRARNRRVEIAVRR